MTSVALALLMSLAPERERTDSSQTVIFYNARLALKDKHPTEVLKLWLLHNIVQQRQPSPHPHDADFHSLLWAALGDLGLCADGIPRDDKGANLWPVALHNYVLLAAARGTPPDQPSPFEAFEAGQQQRFISLNDVLDAPELRSVTFFPSNCNQPDQLLTEFGWPPPGKLTDRIQLGYVLQSLLRQARESLVAKKVTHINLIDVRLFDLDLELARLEAVAARLRAAEAEQKARSKGVSAMALPEVRAAAETWSPDSPQAAFLRETMEWKVEEWMALSKERRLALFSRARPFATPEARDALALAIIDVLTDNAEGAEIDAWLSLYRADQPDARRRALVEGERGKRLLGLDSSTGFHERGPIALHRGVQLLESGDQREALRSFAIAMSTSTESREQSTTLALARRWLSYVLGSYATNDELIAALKALIPPLEYNTVIEELVWKAALRADNVSFERLVSSSRRGGSFDARVARLRPLSQGKAGELVDELIRSGADEPHAMLRFVNLLLEHVEAEELPVRQSLIPLLKLLSRAMDDFGERATASKGQLRRAEELAARNQSILTGLGHLTESSAGKARGLSPGQPAFAGNIRLAPVDPLPWPFPPIDPSAASPFRPVVLEPVEWRDAGGNLIFAWKLSE